MRQRPFSSRTLANHVGGIIASVQLRERRRSTNSVAVAGQFTCEADCNPVKGASVTVPLSEPDRAFDVDGLL